MFKGEHIEFSIPQKLNLGCYFLDVNMELGRGEKTALYYQDATYSFSELYRLTNKLGNVFRELGVEPENRVLLILENSPEWIAAWFATMKVGGVGTHAYTYLTAHDYAFLLNLVRPKVVVVDGVTLDVVREAAKHGRYPHALLVAGETSLALGRGEFDLRSMLKSADERLEVEPTHRDDLAFWNFSGGTTGNPKGVPHMHRDGVVCYETFNHVLTYGTEDTILSVPKLFFHYARDPGMLFPLRNGASVIVSRERTTAALIFDLIRKHRPTVLLNVPTMMRSMIQTPEHQRSDLSCLRYCMSSGELLSAQLHEEWLKTFGIEVFNRYGSAESAMGMLNNRPGAVIPGSTGTVAPMVEVKLVDREGLEVPRGEVGTLLVRCPSAGRYYVRDHEKSKDTFLGNDWINTGDLFKQDENDYFWNAGRADEMVKVSGVWVSPLEIERTLQEYASVKECVALGIRDKDGLTKIKAFVALTDTAKAFANMHEELRVFCRQTLAPHKVPKAIEIMDELPKTGQGKIDRRLLRERPL
jgi:benzoate-CoA ligase family protein